ncbi:hypothetical protein GCM10023339_34660 [Alloalcanivorax gelatiniphagus]
MADVATCAVGEEVMRSVLSRSAHADQLEAEVRDATCCVVVDRCWACEVKLGEVRAARRDAVLHSLGTLRPRRFAR